jgi:hypothetical protein
LNDSPWAQSVVAASTFAEGAKPPDSTSPNGHPAKFINSHQLLSALPIRQAIVREKQIEANYDQMTHQDRQAFDQSNGQLLTRDFSETIVLRYVANGGVYDPPPGDCLLKAPDRTNIKQTKTEEVSVSFNHIVIDVEFPRLFNGKPLFTSFDKEISITCSVPIVGGTGKGSAFVGHPNNFIIKKMLYQGKLEY